MKTLILAMMLMSSNAQAIQKCVQGSGFPCQNKYDQICTKPYTCACPVALNQFGEATVPVPPATSAPATKAILQNRSSY